jgi:ABC-type sugar transport system ATPase subunit
MATIQLQDVTKTYPPARGSAGHGGLVMALDHVSLTIPDGQTFAVVGPSGCGKTTLLRVIAGLDRDFSGRVFYDGDDMAGISAGKRYIGMVFQNYALYPHLRGRGNLEFFFRVHKAPDEETEERIRITSEMMGIGFKELLRRKPGRLSGGQKQRVAIARALVRKPRLFLLDEPLSNLDAKLRAQTRAEIKRLLQRFQITAVYVTHDQAEAIALGDRIAVMRDGRVEQIGTYRELRHDPANAFVAGFLGRPPMNLFLRGAVSDGVFHLGGIAVPLPEATKAHVRAGQGLALGVHPEAACLIGGDRPRPDGILLRGTAEIIEPDFGHRTQTVYARTGELSYAASGALDISLDVGDEVEVVFPFDALYFFDGETGRRL